MVETVEKAEARGVALLQSSLLEQGNLILAEPGLSVYHLLALALEQLVVLPLILLEAGLVLMYLSTDYMAIIANRYPTVKVP